MDCLDLSDVGDGFLVRTVGAAGTLRPSVRSLPRSPREGGMPEWKSDELTITVSHVFKLLHISTEATSSSGVNLTSFYNQIVLFYEQIDLIKNVLSIANSYFYSMVDIETISRLYITVEEYIQV